MSRGVVIVIFIQMNEISKILEEILSGLNVFGFVTTFRSLSTIIIYTASSDSFVIIVMALDIVIRIVGIL